MIYITGDVHAKFAPVAEFCQTHDTTDDDVLIILGDAGINFHGEAKDRAKKDFLKTLPITLFCLHGNHDMRPTAIDTYKEVSCAGGIAYVEDGYENLLFAKDGELFDFDGLRTITLGGAYSIDKELRIGLKWPWFEDEQPSDAIRQHAETILDKNKRTVDVVLSHTAPLSKIPFSKPPRFPLDIDTSTERWLDTIEQSISYRHWYCGHFHVDKDIENFTYLFNRVLPFGHFRTFNHTV